MDENNENPDNKPDRDQEENLESAKRFKSSDLTVVQCEEASNFLFPSESGTTDAGGEVPSGSGERAPSWSTTFLRTNFRARRNYRNSRRGDNESEGENTLMVEEEEEDIIQVLPQADDDEEEQLMDADDQSDEDDDSDDSTVDSDDHDLGGADFSGLESSDSANSGDSAEIFNALVPDFDINAHPLFQKETPKHTWFAINELNKRQLGNSSKVPTRELFQRRCYGSLNSVKRLELMYKLAEHRGCVNSLNFHPNGSLLASGSDDLKVVVWDWKIGKMLTKFKTRHKGNIFQSKFLHLAGDLHIVTCSRDGQVRLAQLNSDEGVRNARKLGSHLGPCHKLIVLPDQPHIILSAGEDGLVLRHDIRLSRPSKVTHVNEENKAIALYSIHGHPLNTDEFCVCGRDSTVRVYDQRKSKTLFSSFTAFGKVKQKRGPHITCAMYNHNGSEILASYSDSDIYLFDTSETKPEEYLHRYQGHRNVETIKSVNFFGPKSEFIVSGSDCGHIYFWEKNTEALVQWLSADDNGVVNCVEPHPQLPFLCSSGLDWDIKVWAPSRDQGPLMEGLEHTLKKNLKKKMLFLNPRKINDGQLLAHLMLQRQAVDLTIGEQLMSVTFGRNRNTRHEIYYPDSASSSDDDNIERVPNCSTH